MSGYSLLPDGTSHKLNQYWVDREPWLSLKTIFWKTHLLKICIWKWNWI